MNRNKALILSRLSRWHLFQPTALAHVQVNSRSMICFTYHYGEQRDDHDSLAFSIDRNERVLHLSFIAIRKKYHSKGYGSQLYSVIEKIASDFGCREVVQVPSGWTVDGELRRDYLIRRGYHQVNGTPLVRIYLEHETAKLQKTK